MKNGTKRKIKKFCKNWLAIIWSLIGVILSIIALWNDYKIMPWIFITAALFTIIFYQRMAYLDKNVQYQVRLEECILLIGKFFDIEQFVKNRYLPEVDEKAIVEYITKQLEDVKQTRNARFEELSKKHGNL